MATGGGGGGSGAVRAGAAFVELYTNDSKLVTGLKSAQRRVAAYASAVSKVGGVMFGAGAAGLAAAGVATGAFLSRAKDLQFLATKLGVPVERLSAFAYAAETTGVSLEELAGHFENLAERVKQGAEGTGEAADTFRRLNIDAAQLIKLAPDEQMVEIARAMRAVTNETQRLGMLSSLGGDQFQKLNDLFRQGPDAIRKYMADAQRLGVALTPEQVEKAAAANTELNRAWAVGKGLVGQLATAILPSADAIKSIGSLFTVAAQAAAEFIKNNRALLVTGLSVATGMATVGAALVGVGGAMALAAAGVNALLSPGGLVVVGAAAAAAAFAGMATAVGVFATQTETGREAVNALLWPFRRLYEVAAPAFQRLGDLFNTTYEGMTAAAASGRFELAGKIAMAGLNAVWAEGLNKVQGLWNGFKATFVDGFHDAVTAVTLAFVDMADRIRGVMANLSDDMKRSLAKWLPRAMAIPGAGVALAGLAASGAVGAFNDLAGLDPEAAKQQIRDRAAAEQANRNMLRANAAIGTAIMSGFARQRLQTLVDEANAAGPKPAAPRGFQGVDKPRLDKAVGAFLQGANGLQVFGSTSPQQMLLNENKKQTSVLQAVKDNTGAIKDQMKWIGDGLKFK